MLVNIFLICGASLAVVHTFEDKPISQWLADNGYSTLVSLLKQAGLYDTLNGPGGRSVTLFAPTNDAFQSVSPSLPELSLPGSLEVYKKILRNHVVNGVFPTNTLHNGEVFTALGGRTLHVSINSSGVLVTPSGSITTGKLTETDIQAINGLIHVVDHVLIPQGLKRSAPAK
ncbi:periostin-like isoform X2 [Ruditapes philippinarum]|uniref:periostin-like isoform X2 n=1 Tax=Ruditapes philippinarum TaxID=129788 RepID=UPI00295B991F|nr:periostin-like isoform X2 [Ruditapes philippinarum]